MILGRWCPCIVSYQIVPTRHCLHVADRVPPYPPPTCVLTHPSPQDPGNLDWLASATGIEELFLWLLASDWEPHVAATLKWAHWAARLPRLHMVQLGVWVSDEHTEWVPKVWFEATRAEGEGVEPML